MAWFGQYTEIALLVLLFGCTIPAYTYILHSNIPSQLVVLSQPLCNELPSLSGCVCGVKKRDCFAIQRARSRANGRTLRTSCTVFLPQPLQRCIQRFHGDLVSGRQRFGFWCSGVGIRIVYRRGLLRWCRTSALQYNSIRCHEQASKKWKRPQPCNTNAKQVQQTTSNRRAIFRLLLLPTTAFEWRETCRDNLSQAMPCNMACVCLCDWIGLDWMACMT